MKERKLRLFYEEPAPRLSQNQAFKNWAKTVTVKVTHFTYPVFKVPIRTIGRVIGSSAHSGSVIRPSRQAPQVHLQR